MLGHVLAAYCAQRQPVASCRPASKCEEKGGTNDWIARLGAGQLLNNQQSTISQQQLFFSELTALAASAV
jgi:hypothetical protein